MRERVRLALGVGLAVVFAVLVARAVGWREVTEALRGLNGPLVAASVVVFFAGYACRVQRWRVMLRRENPALGWWACAGPLMASVAANNVLPFRAGDLLRSFSFNRRLGITATTSITTLLVERLLDLLMIIVTLGLALLVVGADQMRLLGVSGGALVVLALAIAVFLLLPRLTRPVVQAVLALLGRVAPGLQQRLQSVADKVYAALDHVARPVVMRRLIGWSGLAWLFEALVFWLMALAVPAVAVPSAAWLAMPVGTLSTAIPSTPGYVGTFDFFTAQAMQALGNTAAAATAFALAVHLVLWLPATVVGGLYLLVRPLKRDADAGR